MGAHAARARRIEQPGASPRCHAGRRTRGCPPPRAPSPDSDGWSKGSEGSPSSPRPATISAKASDRGVIERDVPDHQDPSIAFAPRAIATSWLPFVLVQRQRLLDEDVASGLQDAARARLVVRARRRRHHDGRRWRGPPGSASKEASASVGRSGDARRGGIRVHVEGAMRRAHPARRGHGGGFAPTEPSPRRAMRGRAMRGIFTPNGMGGTTQAPEVPGGHEKSPCRSSTARSSGSWTGVICESKRSTAAIVAHARLARWSGHDRRGR